VHLGGQRARTGESSAGSVADGATGDDLGDAIRVAGLQVATAVTVYLAHRRDELRDDPVHVLRMAARAEFDGKPPAHVAQWLQTAGVDY